MCMRARLAGVLAEADLASRALLPPAGFALPISSASHSRQEKKLLLLFPSLSVLLQEVQRIPLSPGLPSFGLKFFPAVGVLHLVEQHEACGGVLGSRGALTTYISLLVQPALLYKESTPGAQITVVAVREKGISCQLTHDYGV